MWFLDEVSWREKQIKMRQKIDLREMSVNREMFSFAICTVWDACRCLFDSREKNLSELSRNCNLPPTRGALRMNALPWGIIRHDTQNSFVLSHFARCESIQLRLLFQLTRHLKNTLFESLKFHNERNALFVLRKILFFAKIFLFKSNQDETEKWVRLIRHSNDSL